MAAYLAFWAGVVALGIKMANDRFPPRAPAGRTEAAVDDAVALLRRRYAAGELERESFLQMSTDLASVDARPVDPVGRDPR